MMNSFKFLGADPLVTADSLERLAADLRRLATGHVPEPPDLREAPILRSWSFMQRPRLCLNGTVFNHPVIGEGKIAMTSELFAIDPGRRWVRTMSRFYELGPVTLRGLPH